MSILALLLQILGFIVGWVIVGLITVTVAAYMEIRQANNLQTFGDFFEGLTQFNYSIGSFVMLSTIWPIYWIIGFVVFILKTPDALNKFFGRIEIGYLKDKQLPRLLASKENSKPVESGIVSLQTIQLYEEDDPKAKNYMQN